MAAQLQPALAHSPYSSLPSHEDGPVLGLSQGNAILLRWSRTKHNVETCLVKDSPVDIGDVVGHIPRPYRCRDRMFLLFAIVQWSLARPHG
jgi:hypothetical protein